MQSVLCVSTHSEEETRAVARSLAKLLSRGDCLVLSGQLGAGKTVFVRGLAEGLGIDPAKVHSPSFTVLNEYRGDPSLFHFDLYRLSAINELTETGWDDYLSREGIAVVEWGERAEHRLPDRYYQVTMTSTDESTRKIDITLVDA
jgi:tRNA threonylcarbamoyladenosine biosynthesis protein TsaE